MNSKFDDSEAGIATLLAVRLIEYARPRRSFCSEGMRPIAQQLIPGVVWAPFRQPDEADQELSVADSVLVMPDWNFRVQDESQSDQIQVIAHTTDAIWVVTPARSLRLGPWSGLLRHLKRTHTPRLIVETEWAPNGGHADIDIALVLLTRELPHGVVRFFRAPQGVAHDDVLRDLERLLAAQGGSTAWGWVHRGDLSADSWRSIDHDPDLDRKQRELASLGESQQVKDLFQVIMARPGRDVPALGIVQTDQPVLSGRDVVAGDLSAPRLPEGITHAVTLSAGDLLLPRSERPGVPTMPVVVREHDLPLHAGHSVVVLRPREPLLASEVEFYSAYFGSSRSRALLRGGHLNRRVVDLTSIGRLTVPVPDRALLEAIGALAHSRRLFREWGQDTDEVLTGMFDRDQPLAEARVELVDKGRIMRQRRAAGEMVTTLEYRIREFYPYPVAYRWRQLQTHVDGAIVKTCGWRVQATC